MKDNAGTNLLSIIIPCYNGAGILEASLPLLLQYIPTLALPWEVIVVDDGSPEPELIKAVTEKNNCRYVTMLKNSGKGAAIRKGMLEAKGVYRIFTDADIPFEMEALKDILNGLQNAHSDIVVGDRTIQGSQYYGKISGFRRMGSRLFTNIVKLVVPEMKYDTQCGLKGFRGDVAENIFSRGRINRFAFDVEVLYLATRQNYKVHRVPVKLLRHTGSSVNMLSAGMQMLGDIMLIRWYALTGKYDKLA